MNIDPRFAITDADRELAASEHKDVREAEVAMGRNEHLGRQFDTVAPKKTPKRGPYAARADKQLGRTRKRS